MAEHTAATVPAMTLDQVLRSLTVHQLRCLYDMGHLACWCRVGPCHADVLLALACEAAP